MGIHHSRCLNYIPHSRPTLGQEEIQRVVGVIESAQIAQGEEVQRFEHAFAEKIGVKHAAGASSGTAALHLILLAMGIGAKDQVIIPSFVCTALLNAIRYVGATPILAEIDPDTFNLDAKDVKERLTRRTKAIIVPHLFGLAANMEDLLALNVPIIEDCAQAVGATFRDRQVGAFGVASIFSFYATKVITTGEGGMVVSNSKDLIERVKDLREYDKKDAYRVRFNYKMTDIQAAIGLMQIGRLDEFIRRRRDIAKKYDRAFESLGLRLPPQDVGSIYFRYVIGLGTDSEPWIRMLQKRNVECTRPVHRPLHLYLGLEGFPRTQAAWEQSLSVPIYPSLCEENLQQVIESFLDTFLK